MHDEQLVELGGPRASYGSPAPADFAAACGFGIARNRPFVDGNKRTALVAVELFLTHNGLELLANDRVCVLTMLVAAAGQMDEAAFARWLHDHTGAG